MIGAAANNGDRIFVLPEQGMGRHWFETYGQSVCKDTVGTDLLCHVLDAAGRSWPGGEVLTYDNGNLSPARKDLEEHRRLLNRYADGEINLVRDPGRNGGYEAYYTFLRLVGIRRFQEVSPEGCRRMLFEALCPPVEIKSMLLKVYGGIGNVVLTTAMVRAALVRGITVYFSPRFDGTGEILFDLFKGVEEPGLHLVTPASFESLEVDVSMNIEDRMYLDEKDLLFNPYKVGEDASEGGWYATFMRNVTGIDVDRCGTFVGGGRVSIPTEFKNRIVICPGGKKGWDPKRWPHMNALLEKLPDPIILCRKSDLEAYEEHEFLKPIKARNATCIQNFDLAQAAALLRHARVVVANDCGMAHVAAATGVPTLVIFGPTSAAKNAHPRPNARTLIRGMACQPCQNATKGPGRIAFNDYYCDEGYRCLGEISPEEVLDAVDDLLSQKLPDGQ